MVTRVVGRFPVAVRWLRALERPLAIFSIWVNAVGFFVMAFAVSLKRGERILEVADFLGAFGVAAALSTVVALVLAGRRRWAVETAPTILTALLAPIGAAYALSWQGLAFRRTPLQGALEIAAVTVSTGAVTGIVIGAVAGVLLILARRHPRAVGWLVVGFLFASILSSVHINAFARLTDLIAQTRLNNANRLEYSWQISSELASAIGAVAGSVLGAGISCAAVRMTSGAQPTTG